MIKKLQLYINLAIIVMVVFGIFYFITVKIIGLFKEPEILKMSELKEIMVSENLVTDYETVYALDTAVSNFIEYCKAGDYKGLYKIMEPIYKKAYSYKDAETKLMQYKENYFNVTDPAIIYGEDSKVVNAYLYDNIYIVVFKGSSNQNVYIAIKLDMSVYKYTFAFVEA